MSEPQFSISNSTHNTVGIRPVTAIPNNSNSINMTYSQLEELINKWTRELDDLERCFISEAVKMNERDCQLNINGDKIATLHDKIEQCSIDQIRLEQELQLFEDQQGELEAATDSIEKELQQTSIVSVRYQYPDRERENIYQLAENCQNELDNILVDVKQMVDRINKQNKSVDGENTNEICSNGNDVMNQVTRILNAHMKSLNWIHQKTNDLMTKLNSMHLS